MSGGLAQRLSGRAWAPLLPALALLTGTLSAPTAQFWYTSLGEHAVLWGPFGTLFVLNAEVAGLSLTAIAITLLILAARGTATRRPMRTAQVLGAAALIGVTANIQTYSFFTATSLAALFLAILSLLQARSRALTLTTVGLVGAVLVLGSTLGSAVGPLPVFALLLLALAPAAWPCLRRHLRLALTAGAVLTVCAAPQVLRTVWGLASGDPFLAYRQDSTSNLGVLLRDRLRDRSPGPARPCLRHRRVPHVGFDPQGDHPGSAHRACRDGHERPVGIPPGAVPILAPVRDACAAAARKLSSLGP